MCEDRQEQCKEHHAEDRRRNAACSPVLAARRRTTASLEAAAIWPELVGEDAWSKVQTVRA